MPFRIRGQEPVNFRHLFGLGDEELAEIGVRRYIATEKPGFPCRISLSDAEVGESVLLINYAHQRAATPYRASGSIFIREKAARVFDAAGIVPPMLRGRLLSVRAYDAGDMMNDAELVEGKRLEGLIEQFFGRPETDYLHIHFAWRGCFACRIDRN